MDLLFHERENVLLPLSRRGLVPGPLIGKSVPQYFGKYWADGIGDLQSLTRHAARKMKRIWKPLKSRPLPGRQTTILKRVNAPRSAWLTHVLSHRDGWRPTMQSRVAIVESAGRLELGRNRKPVAAIGNERNGLDQMGWVAAGNMPLQNS